MPKKKIPAVIPYFLSIVIIIAVWYLFAKKINAPLILPSPLMVLQTLKKVITTKLFWQNFLATFYRVVVSFLISIVFGAVIGLVCSVSSFFKNFFEIPVSIIRSTPVIAIILVAYFWFSSNTVPVFVCVLMTLPIMITAVQSGFEHSDKNLITMAKTFNFSKKELFRYIKIPSCVPYFLNGLLSTFGLSWKVVAASEVICLPKKAIGTMLQQSQVHLETAQVISQTIILVAVSFLIERLLSFVIKGRIRKYE